MDYLETFSLLAKLFVEVFVHNCNSKRVGSLPIRCQDGDINEEVYKLPPPGFFAKDDSGL